MENFGILSGNWFIAFIIILLASTIQGMTGFGAALLAGPTLTLLVEPKLVVVIVMFTGMGNLIGVVHSARKHIDLFRLAPLVLPAVLGVPIGAYILLNVSSSITGLSIATISIMFSVALLLGYSRPFKREAIASLGFGFTSGIMSAGVGMGGPPLILFLSNQGWPKEIFRATVALHFLLIGTLAIVSYIITGVATTNRIISALTLMPASLIGFYFGNLMFSKINSFVFMKVTLIVIFITGIISLYINLGQIG
jgi:uncharacterized protein